MGSSCSVDISIEITNVIWIDPEIGKEEIQINVNELIENNNTLKINLFDNVDDAIEYMKIIYFQETKIIVNGGLYSEFIKNFKENITDMYFSPKIIVFTNNKDNFKETNEEYRNSKNKFYKFGRVANTFGKIKKFLRNERENLMEIENKPKKIKESLATDLIFEYIDEKEKLILPMFFKSLIDGVSNSVIKKYNNYLYNTYSNENDELKSLLYSIEPMSDIPKEILSKYYARIYTVSNTLNQDMSINFRKNKTKNFLPFIKTLYEGLKCNSLPLAYENLLYIGSILSNEEISKIKKYLNKKVKHLPSSIVFSKSFLTFNKDRLATETNLLNIRNETNFSKVLFILEKDDNLDYNLVTHCDLEKISYYKDQRQVLFFPFSSFGINRIKETYIKKERIIVINIVYLGTYLGFISNDKNIINNDNIITDDEFKKEIINFGLIEKTIIENMNYKMIYESFNKYENDMNIEKDDINEENNKENNNEKNNENNNEKNNENINENNKENKNEIKEEENKEISTKAEEINVIPTKINFDISLIDENEIKDNIGEIIIESSEINKDIQIINSFDNYILTQKLQYKKDDSLNKNEKELMKNIEIKINENNIGFSYTYKFNKAGKYKIEYIIKNDLTNINYMFFNCNKISNLFLPKLNTINITNMSNMFSGCNSLTNLSLSKFNTQNVTDMSNLFLDCFKLKKINLTNFETKNVTNMLRMFKNCESLTDLNLSNFNTQNVSNMSEMFFGCNSLKSLDISNFKTHNVINMIGMFNGCSNLEKLNISNFNTQNVINMYCMFSCCSALKNLNLSNFNTQNVTNMHCMFMNCKSLKNLNLSCFNSTNVIDMNWMFNGCDSLKSSNIKYSDKNFLRSFERQRVYKFSKTH